VVLGSLALAGACGTGIGWGASTQGVGWDSALDRATGKRISVVVRARPGREAAVEAAVTRLGHVKLQLRIINGFSASLPTSAVRKLRNVRDLVSVSLNRHLQAMSSSYDPATDIGSMSSTAKITGANAYYQAGYTGAGVTVALIDSGVVPVDGLTAAGKVINGPDLSYESQYPQSEYMDTYGHGTFIAGLIAGKSSSGDFQGMAPDARILSLKVADAHGNTDVSQVIEAIDWVVQHRADNGMNVRVLNMSYGTDSGQPYSVDPLAFAAEQAWKSGIVVVAAAGNAGFAKGGSMTDPAYDPMLLSVGAADTMGTLAIADDTVASFSSNAVNGVRTVDVLVPGAHIVSLRDPGSYIDQTYGSTG
jgi:serine protease AprX